MHTASEGSSGDAVVAIIIAYSETNLKNMVKSRGQPKVTLLIS